LLFSSIFAEKTYSYEKDIIIFTLNPAAR